MADLNFPSAPNTTAKTISVTVRRGTTDDNATVYKDTTTVMKITEIGR